MIICSKQRALHYLIKASLCFQSRSLHPKARQLKRFVPLISQDDGKVVTVAVYKETSLFILLRRLHVS